MPLTDDDVADVLTCAVEDPRGLDGAYALDDDARDHLVRLAGGDARRALTFLEAAAGVADDGIAPGADRPDAVPITLEQAEQAVAHAAVRYDRTGDQHYDVASALIKSMRGSDVDAALHYLARMLEAGEDPRFVARRIVIAASEDVGLADPTALQTAVAAMHAVAQIGMPEARIILAQAVVHNALAPKSNAAYTGINEAIADVRAGKGGPVPAHLRGSGYAGRRPPRARQGVRLLPRRAGRRGRPAVPARRPGRRHRLLPTHRPRLRGPAPGALDVAQGAARSRGSRRGPVTGGNGRRPDARLDSMTVTLGGIAGLIAALAFTYLVVRLGGLLGKAGQILDETTVSLRTTSDNVQPTLKGLTDTVSLTNDQLTRVDSITSSVTTMTTNASALTSLTAATIGTPLIKVAAFSYGVRTAVRGLSRKDPS